MLLAEWGRKLVLVLVLLVLLVLVISILPILLMLLLLLQWWREWLSFLRLHKTLLVLSKPRSGSRCGVCRAHPQTGWEEIRVHTRG